MIKRINQEYTIGANLIKPFGSVWRVYSSTGCYVLKTIRSPKKYTDLVGIIAEYIKAGFHAFVPILVTHQGEAYFEVSGIFYTLSPWVEGLKPLFNNQLHLQIIARCFGKLHCLSKSITIPPSFDQRSYLAEFPERLNFLENVSTNLKMSKDLNRVDRAILKWSDYFLSQAHLSVSFLNNLSPEVRLPLHNLAGFCHNDPAPGNIIIRNGNCYLFDLEYASSDLLIKELAHLSFRALQANQWKPKIYNLLVRAYSEERPLSKEEALIMPYLLCFPRRFWRICHQRYQEHLEWSERRFQGRLWEIICEEKNRLAFIEDILPELKQITGYSC